MVVSIVIPIYQISDRFNMLAQALESIAIQTYESIEVIIVDDGSSDNTVLLVKQFINRKEWKYRKKTKLVKLESNSGVCVARNVGIKNATGDLVAFLDWDDLLFEDYAKSIVAVFIENKDISAVICNGLFYKNLFGYECAFTLKIPFDINVMSFDKLLIYLLGNNFPAPMGSGICFRADIFYEKNLWFDEFLSKKTAEDILFGFQLLEKQIRPYFYTEKNLVIHRAYLKSTSRGRGAVLADFECDAFRYCRSICFDLLIERVKDISLIDYSRLKISVEKTEAEYAIKETLLRFGLIAALSQAYPSKWLIKKWIYYALFLKVDPYFGGGLFPLYSFYKSNRSDVKSLNLAKNYIDRVSI